MRAFVLVAVALASSAGAVPELSLDPAFDLHGWSYDGKFAAFVANLSPSDSEFVSPRELEKLHLALLTDGRNQRLVRGMRENPEARRQVADRTLWDRAEPGDWPTIVADAITLSLYLKDRQQIGGGWDVRVEASPKSPCALALVASKGTARTTVLEDECTAGEKRAREARTSLTASWAPDRRRIALQWTVQRPAAGSRRPRPRVHKHFALVAANSLVSIDLLDSGSRDAVAAAEAELVSAGYSIGHRGQAEREREKTAIYFAPGFEEDAKGIAVLLRVAPEHVQRQDWRSPYPVTVAAAPPAR